MQINIRTNQILFSGYEGYTLILDIWNQSIRDKTNTYVTRQETSS